MLLRQIQIRSIILLKLFYLAEFQQVVAITFDKVERDTNVTSSTVQDKENGDSSAIHEDIKVHGNIKTFYKGVGLNYSATETHLLSILNSTSLITTSPNDTVGNRLKRQGEPRTINVDIGPSLSPGAQASVCFEREVSGTCRYRTAPDECFRHEWTAHATIINIGYHKITSIQEGLVVHPSGHARVRVFLKSSCCNPLVHFIAWDLFLQQNTCIVDVRELQDLHPGEIVGICVGVLLFFIILIIILVLCIRWQRRKKMEKQTVIFGRSLTRSNALSFCHFYLHTFLLLFIKIFVLLRAF